MIGPRPGEAPTLLHEELGCIGLWNDFPAKLQKAIGYGQSSWVELPRPLTYMHDEARDTLPKLLHTIDFRRGFMIGCSDGASIVAIYAGSHQDDRVGGPMLIAPHFFTENTGIKFIEPARVAREMGYLRRRLAGWHANVDNAFRGWIGAWLDPDFRKWDITEFLGYIRVPILIVQGEEDRYGTVKRIEVAQLECH